MNDLTIFNSSEFGEIRTVTIDGKPYFVAVDVAAALGYATPRDAISRHCKGVVKRDTPTSSGIQQMSYINEGPSSNSQNWKLSDKSSAGKRTACAGSFGSAENH